MLCVLIFVNIWFEKLLQYAGPDLLNLPLDSNSFKAYGKYADIIRNAQKKVLSAMVRRESFCSSPVFVLLAMLLADSLALS